MAMVGSIFKLPLMRSVQGVVAAARAWNVCLWHKADKAGDHRGRDRRLRGQWQNPLQRD
jgi:hypothetical protein